MATTHLDSDAALNAAEAQCRARGLALTPVRRRVLELLLEAGAPLKAYDMLSQLKPGGGAQPPTVYRALDFLVGAGLAHKVEALNAYTACAHGDAGGRAELFICETCGHVEEHHARADIADTPKGFHVERSVVEHYGRCSACSDP
ncbi:MAG: Fur family transcriptional regulator [Pseudomonadota bacterium]